MKTREKQLALVLGGLVIVFLIFLGLNYYRKERARLTQARLLLDSTAQEQNIWLRQRDIWIERRQWVRANQPAIASPRAATADLFSLLEEKAKAAGVTIVKSQLYDPLTVEGLDFVEIGVQLSLDANLESLIRWATEVQNPLEFRLFKRFTLNTRDDAPTLKLDCVVVQWCVTGAAAVEETPPAPSEPGGTAVEKTETGANEKETDNGENAGNADETDSQG